MRPTNDTCNGLYIDGYRFYGWYEDHQRIKFFHPYHIWLVHASGYVDSKSLECSVNQTANRISSNDTN